MIFRKFRFKRLMRKREELIHEAYLVKDWWCGTLYLKYMDEIMKLDKKLIKHFPLEQQLNYAFQQQGESK